MTQEAALYQFFNSFGISGYPATAVPQAPILPYLTYQPVSGYWGDSVSITVQIWMKTESESAINAKARAIGNKIGRSLFVPCDGGAMILSRGTPWVVPSTAQEEPTLKMRQLNITIDFVNSL